MPSTKRCAWCGKEVWEGLRYALVYGETFHVGCLRRRAVLARCLAAAGLTVLCTAQTTAADDTFTASYASFVATLSVGTPGSVCLTPGSPPSVYSSVFPETDIMTPLPVSIQRVRSATPCTPPLSRPSVLPALPPLIFAVQQGEAVLAANLAKLKEVYHNMAGAPVEEVRAMRRRLGVLKKAIRAWERDRSSSQHMEESLASTNDAEEENLHHDVRRLIRDVNSFAHTHDNESISDISNLLSEEPHTSSIDDFVPEMEAEEEDGFVGNESDISSFNEFGDGIESVEGDISDDLDFSNHSTEGAGSVQSDISDDFGDMLRPDDALYDSEDIIDTFGDLKEHSATSSSIDDFDDAEPLSASTQNAIHQLLSSFPPPEELPEEDEIDIPEATSPPSPSAYQYARQQMKECLVSALTGCSFQDEHIAQCSDVVSKVPGHFFSDKILQSAASRTEGEALVRALLVAIEAQYKLDLHSSMGTEWNKALQRESYSSALIHKHKWHAHHHENQTEELIDPFHETIPSDDEIIDEIGEVIESDDEIADLIFEDDIILFSNLKKKGRKTENRRVRISSVTDIFYEEPSDDGVIEDDAFEVEFDEIEDATPVEDTYFNNANENNIVDNFADGSDEVEDMIVDDVAEDASVPQEVDSEQSDESIEVGVDANGSVYDSVASSKDASRESSATSHQPRSSSSEQTAGEAASFLETDSSSRSFHSLFMNDSDVSEEDTQIHSEADSPQHGVWIRNYITGEPLRVG